MEENFHKNIDMTGMHIIYKLMRIGTNMQNFISRSYQRRRECNELTITEKAGLYFWGVLCQRSH